MSLRSVFRSFVIVLSVAVLGCATPSKQELATATRPELPADYKLQAEQVIKQSLRDPWSAVIEFRDPPRKGWDRDGAAYGWKLHLGWFVRAWVNAKNGFGGYTGFEPQWLLYCENGWHLLPGPPDPDMTGFSD